MFKFMKERKGGLGFFYITGFYSVAGLWNRGAGELGKEGAWLIAGMGSETSSYRHGGKHSGLSDSLENLGGGLENLGGGRSMSIFWSG